MRFWTALGCTAALVTVAACNQGGEGNEGSNVRHDAAENGSSTVADPVGMAAFMHDRHERYEEIGDAYKGISRELKAGEPSVEAIRRHAELINRYAPQVPSWFPTGSGPEAGRTRAKAEIWTDSETFRQRAEAFRLEAARFNEAAATGDLTAIRQVQPRLAQACKNCHDRFRGPEIEHE